MTLEEAVERVEGGLLPWAEAWENNPALCEALRLVLAAAKRPRVYALGEGERAGLQTASQWLACYADEPEGAKALAGVTAALALEQTEEPFTVAELETIYSCVEDAHSDYCENAAMYAPYSKGPYYAEERDNAALVAAKLRAYIEKKAAPAQP